MITVQSAKPVSTFFFVANTLGEERESQMTKEEGDDFFFFYHLTAGANEQDFSDFYTNAALLLRTCLFD